MREESAYSRAQRWTFLAIITLATISATVDRAIVPILFEPLRQEFGTTDSGLGLLGGTPFAICFALASLPLARLADRRGRKLVLFWSALGWSVMSAMCGLAPTLPLLFPDGMGVGSTEGVANPTSHTLITNPSPPRSRSRHLRSTHQPILSTTSSPPVLVLQ